MRTILVTLLALFTTTTVLGNEAAIRQVLRDKFPGIQVQGVQPAPMPGLFEVRIQSGDGPQIIYTDAQARFLIDGSLIESGSGRNLTQERIQKLSAIDFKQLPLKDAVKIQRGNGKRVLVMFTDPYCPYCRRLEQALLKVDDIAVYVFMYPVIRPDFADHSRAVWCAPDRAKAWLELAAGETAKVPSNPVNCSNPVDKVLELGKSLRITGTPTLFFANGERASGMPIEMLRARLDEVAKATK
jgi:thiol:disulfide interchange protein DsbC